MTTVWYASVSPLCAESVYRSWLAVLPNERRKKAERIQSEEGKRLCVGAWALLTLAYRTLGVDISRLTVTQNRCGKPYFLERPMLHFSLSHSGEYVLCAISDAPVGCDVERICVPDLRVAARFFSEEENRLLSQAADRSELFYRIWTCKESYLKAIGTGFYTPLSLCSVDPTASPPTVKRNGLTDGAFRLTETELVDGYRMAVCTTEELRSVEELSLSL